MPVNRKWNIAALMEACRKFPLRQGRRITFEYVLLRGVNDTDEDAERLVELLRGIPAKVNLIPYNENPGLGFFTTGDERAEALPGDPRARPRRGVHPEEPRAGHRRRVRPARESPGTRRGARIPKRRDGLRPSLGA